MTDRGHHSDIGPIAPHGGKLANRVLTGEARAEALARAAELPKLALNARAM